MALVLHGRSAGGLAYGTRYVVAQQRVAAAGAQAARLTQAILAKAFRGELVAQDPNDEPAAALLERLRRERAGAPREDARKATPGQAATGRVVRVHPLTGKSATTVATWYNGVHGGGA